METMWALVKWFKDSYVVSNYGQVYNINTGRELKGIKIYNGSIQIFFQHKGKKKSIVLHKLVYTHFAEKYIAPKFLVMHKNFNKANNKITNLEKVTRGDYLRLINEHKNKMRGVYIHNSTDKTGKLFYTKWRASFKVKNKLKTFGYFEKKEDAVKCYYESYNKIYGRYPFHIVNTYGISE